VQSGAGCAIFFAPTKGLGITLGRNEFGPDEFLNYLPELLVPSHVLFAEFVLRPLRFFQGRLFT
jgi:hypothetical protein